MRTARRSLAELAANPPSVDRERIAATTDEEIDRQIVEDEDTAPDVTGLGEWRSVPVNASGEAAFRGTSMASPVLAGKLALWVKEIRERQGMTQEEFAATFGFNAWTVKQWEQGRREPTGPARVLLTVINREPDAVRRALAAE